jgi:EVE domain
MAQAPTTWILTGSPENFAATREHGFSVIGMKDRRRNQALQMEPGDRIVFYLTQVGRFAGSVRIAGEVVLDASEQIPAEELKDDLEHVRTWPPGHWRLAFQGQLRTVSADDARMIEERMRSAARGRAPA